MSTNMNTNEENMTPTEAAGYILAVSYGFVRQHYRAFAILFLCSGLFFVLTGFRFTFSNASFVLRFGDAAYLGAVLLAISMVLWLLFRRSK